MVVWMTWLIWAGVLVILEILAGTFYLLMIALGFASAGLAAWLGASSTMQYVVAVLVSACAIYVLRRRKYSKAKINVAGDLNANMDIGRSITVDAWKIDDAEKSTARVMYKGVMWDVELAQGSTPKVGPFIIRAVRGNCLVVSNERRRFE